MARGFPLGGSSDCRKTLVGASIARLCPFALQKSVPEKALLRQVGGRPMVAPTHAIRQECNLLSVCYIISPSINKKAPTQPQNIYGWVGVVYL